MIEDPYKHTVVPLAQATEMMNDYDPTAFLTEVFGEQIAKHTGFKNDVQRLLKSLYFHGTKETLESELKKEGWPIAE